MVPFVRTDGPLQGRLPGVNKPTGPRSSGFEAPKGTDPRWRDRAACRDSKDPEVFHPIGNTGFALMQIKDAKTWCQRCDVATACLAFALSSDLQGVWGNTSDDERRAMKRREARERQQAAKQPA